MQVGYERTSRLILLPAFIELGLGLGMSVRLPAYAAPVYAPAWPYFTFLSTLFLAGGGVLLERGRYRLPLWLQAVLALIPAAPPALLAALCERGGAWIGMLGYGILAVAILAEPWIHRTGARTEPVRETPLPEIDHSDGTLPGLIPRLETWAPPLALCVAVVVAMAVDVQPAVPLANVGIAVIIGYLIVCRWVAPSTGSNPQRAFWHVAFLTVSGGLLFALRGAAGQGVAALLIVMQVLSARALGQAASRRLLYLLLVTITAGESAHFLQGHETGVVALSQTVLELASALVAGAVGATLAREQGGLVRQLASANADLQAHQEELIAQQEELMAQHEELLAVSEAMREQQEQLTAQNDLLTEKSAALKWQQEEFERFSQRLELILNAAGDGICGVDTNGRATFVNPAAAHILGYEVSQLIGMPCYQIFGSRTAYTQGQCPLGAIALEGSPRRDCEAMFRRRDGGTVPVEWTAMPLREQGSLVGAVITFRDITERRAIDRMKNEFVSVVSHELRTPLTSIRGSLGLLASGALGQLSPKANRMVEIAAKNSDRLVRLINDILDIERMESGIVFMEPTECDAATLMTQAVDTVRALAVKAGVTMKVEPLQAKIQADPDRIVQTLTNLLANAIKFSPAGSTVTLTARREADHYLFEVTDQGRGIPADKLESIFERFQQVDASDSRQKGGTGLGLAICRSIVQQHGGRIWAESTPGAGSRISFTLPAPKLPGAPAPDEPAPAEQPARPPVLVCHFDPERTEALRQALQDRGHALAAAGTSSEAVAEVRARRLAAVLINLGDPGKAGLETIAAIKAVPGTADLPVVICSNWTVETGALESGGTVDWAADPLDAAKLVQALERALARQSRGVKVLIVEDDPDLASVLLTMFQRHGARPGYAHTGRAAIAMMEAEEPDLVVLDLYLPEVDGFAVVNWLRGHERLKYVPLVIYTARDLSEADRQALQTGHTTFLTKGRISPADFEKRIVTFLAQSMAQQGGGFDD